MKGLLAIRTLTKHQALQTANKRRHPMRRSQAPPHSSEEQMPANPCQPTSHLPTPSTSRMSESSTFHLQTLDQNLPRSFAPPARYSDFLRALLHHAVALLLRPLLCRQLQGCEAQLP